MKKLWLFSIIIVLLVSVNSLAADRFKSQWEELLEINQESRSRLEEDELLLNYELAVIYANLGEIEKANDIIQSIGSREGREELEEIIPIYEKRYKEDPKDIVNNNHLAFSYFIDKRYKESEKMFNEIIIMDPKNLWSYNYLAVVQHQMEYYEKAHYTLEEAMDIEENDYTHFLLGANYYKRGRMFRALYHVRKGRRAAQLFLD